MSDAAWMNLAPILNAAAVLVGAFGLWYARIAAHRSSSAQTAAEAAQVGVEVVNQKTDDQTVTISAIDRKADIAVVQTNGMRTEMQARIDALRQQLAESKAHIASLEAMVNRSLATADAAIGGRRLDDLKPPEKETP